MDDHTLAHFFMVALPGNTEHHLRTSHHIDPATTTRDRAAQHLAAHGVAEDARVPRRWSRTFASR